MLRITLPRLSEQAIGTLCENTPFDPGELYRQTGGNPFYATEVLASGASSIPPTVRDAVLTRAARISPAARSMLDAAAVIGAHVEPRLLAAVVEQNADAVDECLAVGLLVSRDHGLQFRHQLTQEVLLDALSPVRATELHRKVLAAWLSRSPAANDLATLAHHAEAAGDADAVMTFAPAAARRANELGAHREAAAQYARALRFCDPSETEQQINLLERWNRECFATGQNQDAIDAAAKLVSIARSTGDTSMEAYWHASMAANYVVTGRNAEADRASKTSIELLQNELPGKSHAFVSYIQARLRMLNRDFAAAIAWGEHAIAVARQFDDVETLANAIGVVGASRIVGGEPEQGRIEMEQSLALAREAGLEIAAAAALTNLGSGHGEIFQLDIAERYLTEGIAYAIERDLDGWRWYMVAWLALVRMHQGDWNEAVNLAETVIRRPMVEAIARMMALVAIGRVRTRRGDPETATVLDEALDLATPTNTLQRLAPVHAARADAAWLAGDKKRTETEARAVYDLAVAHQHPWFIGELAYWRWKTGDLSEAPPHAAQPYALQINGDWAGAAALWKALGCPYEAARALTESHDEGALRTALATFQHLGARPAAAHATRQLWELGALDIPRGPRPGTRSNPALLTPREFEVLELMATSITNNEIATLLFLSPKTIEHHVSAVLAKLQVRTRREAIQAAKSLNLIPQVEG